MASLTTTLARGLGLAGTTPVADKSIDHAGRVKLVTLCELPKALYATNLAVTSYPHTRRERKAVFNHVEVYKMVESVANKLREAGVRPGTVCAMALPNSFEAIVYFFALQWIGAVAAPVDISLHSADLVTYLQDVRAQTLVSPFLDTSDAADDPLYQATLKATEQLHLYNWHIHRTTNDGVILEMGGRTMGSAAWSGGAGDFKLDPEEIAIHVRSEVSTLPLSHRALAAAAKSFSATYGLSMSMSTVLSPPLHSIHGVLVLISVFYTGGHIILPGNAGSSSASKFWELAKTHDVTWLSASPKDILDIYEAHPHGSAQQLSFVRSSDGRLAPDVLAKVEQGLKCPVLESCGVAEAAGLATANTVEVAKLGTVGKPVEGIRVALFDAVTGKRIENGTEEDGEIAVCGEHAANGYLSDMITEESSYRTTTTSTTGEITHTQWLSTGQRGTIDEDGFVSVLDGDARELRAAQIAAIEEEQRREALRKEQEMRAQEAERAAALALATRNTALISDERALDGIDDETADAILARLAAIESNQRRLEHDLADKHASELEDLRARLQEAEAAADRAARGEVTGAGNGAPTVLDIRMEELEAAVMAAAASAEMSANNTREAVKVAREVAETAYGTNQSRDVAIATSTGDQGALTKTVRVALDDVESAMQTHPAVLHAKAFGRKDRRFGAEVFCAIVPKKGARVSEPWLKLHAQSVLPGPMVPKKFYYLDELPMHMSRRELSESHLLKELSAFPGYSEVKHVKGPSFLPLQRGTTVTDASAMGPRVGQF